MSAEQAIDYLREVVGLFPDELKETVAKVIIEMQDRDVFVLQRKDFTELHQGWLKSQQQPQSAHSENSESARVRIKGR